MKSIYLFCFAAFLIAAGCKDSTTTNKEETSATADGSSTPSSQTVQPNAPSGGHDQTFLTDKLFHYKAAHVVGSKSNENPYAGQWIDLDPDGTYKAGTLKEQTHTGRWDYNVNEKVLLLRPDDNKFKISEWKVMHNNDMVVWIGTQTYGNNATQIQLVRSAELP